MKHLFIFSTFFTLILISCNNNYDVVPTPVEEDPVGTFSTVETTDYTLPTGCRWVYTVPVGKNSGISIINSQEELVKHVSSGNVPSSVDFNKYSLLLAYGDSISNVHTLSYQLFRDSENEYKLDVNFLSGTKTWLEGWTVALLIPKIPQNTVVQLNEVISQGNPGEYENPYMDDISGIWKLSFSTADNDTVNFSGKSVIYEFKEDGKLIVTGSMPGSLAEGEHTYAYKKPNVCQTCSPVPNMRIDNDDDLFCDTHLQNQTIVISGKKTEQGKTVIWNINLVKAENFEPDDKEISKPDDELYIHAKVEYASNYSNAVGVKLMGFDRSIDKNIELARGEWKDDGFTIVLPKTLEPNYLHALINNNGLQTTISDTPLTMTISNKNVKVGNVNFWGVNKEGNWVTYFYPFIIDEDGYAKSAFYTYVDSDVTISGYSETEVAIARYDKDKEENIWYLYKKTTTYSIEWKKGWNVWYLSSITSSSERTVTEKWSTISVSQLKW